MRSIYNAKKASHKAYVRRTYAKYQCMKIVGNEALRSFVARKLTEGRSPESISGRIKNHEKRLPDVSADSIERFLASVYGRAIEIRRTLIKNKRRWRKKRARATMLKDRKFIDRRPYIINRRGRVGDVEADFIVSGTSGKGIILSVADRKLRVSFLERVLPVSISNVHRAFGRIKRKYPELRTITIDNDILLNRHKELAMLLGVRIYFCHPYHSWEKGTIENTNGEIRKHIPKGSDISRYSLHRIRSVERKINDRYMKVLGFRTPREALDCYRKQKNRVSTRS